MKRNLLLEYSEELAIKIAKLCSEYKIDSNTVFQIKKSSSSVFANITEAQYPQSLAFSFCEAEPTCIKTNPRDDPKVIPPPGPMFPISLAFLLPLCYTFPISLSSKKVFHRVSQKSLSKNEICLLL